MEHLVVETKVFNQAVKRNIKRFPQDFIFQLTKDELEKLGRRWMTKSYKNILNYNNRIGVRGHLTPQIAIDATKMEDELDWKTDENFDTGIVKTIEWYLKKYGLN